MKRLPLMSALIAFGLVAGCSSTKSVNEKAESVASPMPAARTDRPNDQVFVRDGTGDAVVQKVKFRVGVSSATVERLARRFGCTSTQGAGLVTEEGPVEVYRMQCENGTTFVAECELRQCRPMR